MRRTDGWFANIVPNDNLRRFNALYLGQQRGRDQWFMASVGENGELVMTEHPDETAPAPPTLYLPRGADVALAEALADRSPDAEWKARAEERQTALDREVARVDRILGERR